MTLDDKKQQAQTWFRTLRDRICTEFEKIEQEYATSLPVILRAEGSAEPGALDPAPVAQDPGNTHAAFTRTTWARPEGGGGEMSKMKGRVFEKVGVNISTVHGEFSEAFRKEIPGAAEDPRFWATGISLVAHMANPHIPAIHMNTRMIVVGSDEGVPQDESGTGENSDALPRVASHGEPEAEGRTRGSGSGGGTPPAAQPPPRLWFGGGSDLNPALPNDADTRDFHAAFQSACDLTDPAYYEKFKQWCDEYFWNKHRNEPRGVGGIFYDYLEAGDSPLASEVSPDARKGPAGPSPSNSSDWEKHFRFTQTVGKTFLDIYPAIVRRHMHEPWSEAERHTQLVRRGRYAEFNLLHDRGTRFGLMTGGNPEAILMSLPPVAIWE